MTHTFGEKSLFFVAEKTPFIDRLRHHLKKPIQYVYNAKVNNLLTEKG